MLSVTRAARAAVAALFACAVLHGLPAAAIVESATDGMGTVSPPPDDPGFGHVGVTANGLSAIYIGNGWVLSAAHVNQNPVTLAGVTYPDVPNSTVQLQQPGVAWSDIILFRLTTRPPMAPLVLSSTPPAIGDNVTMIGYGWDRAPGQVCWNSSWAEVGCNPGATYRGYKSAGPFRMRWGQNLVTQVGTDLDFGSWRTRAFDVRFDQSGVAYEAQAVPGDSGGAVFLKRNGQWQLAGVMFAVSVFQGQNQYNTAVFGQSTYAVDVSYYRSQIASIVAAPAIPALPWTATVVILLAIAATGGAALSLRTRAR
jgi:trypsin-like peptidase